jgi:hypothetical protein
MAQLSDSDLEAIISRDLPGHQIVRRKSAKPAADAQPAEARPDVDDVSPDIDELRRKFLGEGAAGGSQPVEIAAAPEEADAPDDDVEDEIVMVEPNQRDDPLDHGSRPKAVVVSGKERRVIGYQG